MTLATKKKLLIVTPSLYGGGAERVLVLLLRHLDRSLFDPSVVMFGPENDFAADIPDDVRITILESRGKKDALRLVRKLAHWFKKESPDIILTSLYRVNYLSLITMLARRLSHANAMMVLAEHGNLSWCMERAQWAFVRSALIRNNYLYPATDAVICVSKGLQEDLTRNWGVSESQTRVIHNPVELEMIEQRSREPVDHAWFQGDVPVIIACGRLDVQKNYPLLLRAFRRIRSHMGNACLAILGEGPLKQELLAYVADLDLAEAVTFLGFQKNPFKYISRARMLVLSSSMEGFPMAILEAMACSTPVVSTQCRYGPEEIISHGENGLLVPIEDEKALADAVLQLLRDESSRKKIAAAGRQKVEDFRADVIARKYEATF